LTVNLSSPWLAAVIAAALLPTPARADAVRAPEAPAPPPPATAGQVQEVRSDLSTLEAALEAQKTDLAKLGDDLAAEREARMAAEAATRRLEDAGKSAPAVVQAARAGIGLGGFLQADVPFRQSSQSEINGSTGDLLNQNRFYLRRARVRVTAQGLHAEGAFELDANTIQGPTARAIGAEASLKLPGESGAPPLVMATMGLFKTPFGFEIGESDRDRLFMERSTAEQALFPGEYDAGVRLSGGWRFLRYALGWMNGEPLGERTFPGRDPNKLKDLVGRLGVDVGATDAVTVRGGLSALGGHGFHRGTTATKDVVQWRDLNGNRLVDPGELAVIPGTAPTASFNFDRHAFGADLGVAVVWPGLGRTNVYGEVYLAQNLDRGVLPYDQGAPGAANVRELGWYAAATQQIGPHLMVGARVDRYDPDRDATETQMGRLVTRNRSFTTVAFTAALVGPLGRLMLEWDHNRNHLGRDLLGAPTSLADDAVIVRGQVNF
jgi:hypothetical protein